MAQILKLLFVCLLTGCTSSPTVSPRIEDSETDTSDAVEDTGDKVTSLGAKYADHFDIGAAVDYNSYITHYALLEAHFNSITPENEMKFDWVQRTEGEFTFGTPDRMVDYAEQYGMAVRGHALIWHRQTPAWVFEDNDGAPISAEALLARMEAHISEVVGHYKDRVKAWDVVNEAVMNDGSYRTGEETGANQSSPWYAILGERYIAEAFVMAHAAAPDAKLFYNDYYHYLPEKRQGIYDMLEELLSNDAPVHGVGLQCHLKIETSMDSADQAYYQTPDHLAEAIEAYASLGLEIHITEMDVSLYSPNVEYTEDNYYTIETFTDDVEQIQAARYGEFFDMFRAHGDAIASVTFWGIADDNTWLSELSSGRTDFPLLFDVDHEPKAAFDAIFNF